MRNRYLDLLRAVAIVRVVVYHHFGWAWLSLAFPAMGVMFAVAGSLTAASLQKRPAGEVVGSRMRRLLPPVWLLGLITVPVMLYTGWASETDGEHPFQLATLLFWLIPIGDPPGSDSSAFVWDALWYIRTYLWLVVLSPLLFPLFRKVGWPLLALPLLLMLALQQGSWGMPAGVESALWDLATYGACWLAGFAHRDGRLRRLNPFVTVAAFAGLAALGLRWLIQGHEETGWDLNQVSEAQAVYSLAFVLIVLRWQPPIGRLMRIPQVSGLVTLLNSRAVTVYLWHGVAIASVWPILAFIAMEDLSSFEAPVTLGITFAVTAVAVLLFGWAEDLAARRRPRLWPADEHPGGRPASPVDPIGPVPAGWPEVDRDGEPVGSQTRPAAFPAPLGSPAMPVGPQTVESADRQLSPGSPHPAAPAVPAVSPTGAPTGSPGGGSPGPAVPLTGAGAPGPAGPLARMASPDLASPLAGMAAPSVAGPQAAMASPAAADHPAPSSHPGRGDGGQRLPSADELVADRGQFAGDMSGLPVAGRAVPGCSLPTSDLPHAHDHHGGTPDQWADGTPATTRGEPAQPGRPGAPWSGPTDVEQDPWQIAQHSPDDREAPLPLHQRQDTP